MKSDKEIREIALSLLNQMSNEEKACFLYGDGAWHIRGNERLHINPFIMHDGPSGMRIAFSNEAKEKYPKDEATCYPAPCLLACSWNPETYKKVGESLGEEAIEANTDMVLAPGVNIKRNPLCGRNFEYLSEDPLLAGILASGYINGVQSKGIGTCIKHFACNNQETYRSNNSSEVDKKALNEIYLKQFEIAIKSAKPWAVMHSYNRVNGIQASGSSYLLKEILRDEWKYEGLVMSDWGAALDPYRSHNEGMDLEMPCKEDRHKAIAKAVKRGALKQEALDRSALHAIELSLKSQFVEKQKDPHFSFEKGYQVAKEAAEDSMVLLKNDGILPLSNFNDCCVIGSLANSIRYQGSGSSKVSPAILKNFLDVLPKGIPFEEGYSLTNIQLDECAHKKAINLAKNSKNVLLFLGLPDVFECEGFDRKTMKLPSEQIELAKSILEVNKNVIVVLSLGSPVELPFASEAKAILLSYLGGEAMADALSDLLLGKINPSGKLAETWPSSYEDVPFGEEYPGGRDVSLYKESVFVGYRYYEKAGIRPLYPFGYGLSYTTFKYSDLRLSQKDGQIFATYSIQNTGDMAGQEVSELYVSYKGSSVTFRPLKELKGFSKDFLEAGEKKGITIEINVNDLRVFDLKAEKFLLEAGEYEFSVGSSSQEILLRQSLNIASEDVLNDLRDILPSYYAFGEKTPLAPSMEEFERLLGHEITKPLPLKPYTLNSTLGDIKDTFIGKIIFKEAVKQLESEFIPDSTQKEQSEEMLLENSLRMMFNNSVPDKCALAIVNLANHKFFHALFDALFGEKK